MMLLHSLRMICRLAAAAALLAVAEAGPSFMPGRAADRAQLGSSALTGTPRLQNFARTPLCFEANQGQTDRQVQYLAPGPRYTLFSPPPQTVLAPPPGGPLPAPPSARRPAFPTPPPPP